MSDMDNEQAHEGEIVIGEILTRDGPPELRAPTVKHVHYPGAQQLILWLPQPGYQGYGDLTVTHGGGVIEHATVRSRLNGSVQILWNTLPWPPGDYVIVIRHDDGWRHEVKLHKFEGAAPKPPPVPEPAPRDAAPIVYRDGFGNVLPNIDLELREAVRRDLARKFSRRLEYDGSGRAGTIYYLDGERRIAFPHEMCGGPMKFSIDVPPAAAWEATTGVPLAERDEIVAFVAERVKREQAPSWRYEITGRSIDFY